MDSRSINMIERCLEGVRVCDAYELQSLWSGYGKIFRVQLDGYSKSSVILKHIKFPREQKHPRGWSSAHSHQRKLHSYEVESLWYQNFASQCGQSSPVPSYLGIQKSEREIYLLLSDLHTEGFDEIKQKTTEKETLECLSWLAHFHAQFMKSSAMGLWQQGTYWHLDTRLDELQNIEDERLKQAAPLIDQKLRQANYQCLVHGDAKLANFCFAGDNVHKESTKVAAVDFQYVGVGCGMKDLVYFLGSSLSEYECEHRKNAYLKHYFLTLRTAVATFHPDIDLDCLEKEWRSLYEIAWADFHRFLAGWCPDHWKINNYSQRVSEKVVNDMLSESQ